MVDFPVIIMVWKIHFFLKIKPMNELFIIKENMNHNYLDTIIKTALTEQVVKLNERMVLKVPGNDTSSISEPVKDTEIQMDNGNKQPGIGDNMSNFGEKFDAGVEADLETDPKKYIQQLTGKLSQELRKYNDGSETNDIELNKYVLGMIIKPAGELLTDRDKKEIIKKLNTSSIEENEPLDNNEPEYKDEPSLPEDAQVQQFGENITYGELDEIVDGILSKVEPKRMEKKLSKIKTNGNPFISKF